MNATAEKMTLRIGGVPSNMIMDMWPGAEPLLARVVKPDTGYTLQSVLNSLQLAKMQLWVVNDFQGVIVTQIEDRPAQRILYTLFLAGDNMSEWIDEWCEIQDEYARHNGCAAVEFNGRKGWNKIGESKPEWKAIRTVFRRELN
jgi:hypothetical protein